MSLTLMLVSVALAPKRLALIVGIDQYPILPANRRLAGAKADVETMGLLLRAYGFQCATLVNENAQKVGIETKLQSLVAKAAPGDDLVFYFSGLGSMSSSRISANPLKEMEPCLVPYDGNRTRYVNDIRMGFLERAAAKLPKGARITYVIDASFCNEEGREHYQDKAYNDVPRTLVRKGEIRAELYQGQGVFLAASGSRGAAYEWRSDFAQGRWAGAFTDVLANAAMEAFLDRRPVDSSEVLATTRMFFLPRAKTGYMVGLNPYSANIHDAASYDAPLFTSQSFAEPTATLAAETKRRQRIRFERERTLAVAIDREASTESEKMRLAPVEAALREALGRVAGLRCLDRFGDAPDRLIYLHRNGDAFQVRVASSDSKELNDPITASDSPIFAGGSGTALLENGLEDYLCRQRDARHLLQVIRRRKPTWTLAANARCAPRYKAESEFQISLDLPSDALGYLLMQTDQHAVPQLVVPIEEFRRVALRAGKQKFPDVPYAVFPGADRTRLWLLLVEADALRFPPLDRAVTPRQYLAAERVHREALIRALETGEAKWCVREMQFVTDP